MSPLIRHSCTAASGVLMLVAAVSLLYTAHARPPSRTLSDKIGSALLTAPDRWPWVMAKQFAESLPLRIARPLSAQTSKTVGAFIARTEVPWLKPQHDSAWVCVASCGSGGSFVALMTREGDNYTVVWDSLLAPSIIRIRIDHVDLDDDGNPEIVYGGRNLNTDDREWAILSWRERQVNVLAPRLDVPARHVRDNRLIGDSLIFLGERDSGFRRVLTWRHPSRENWVVLADDATSGRIVFSYNDSLRGYLPAQTTRH